MTQKQTSKAGVSQKSVIGKSTINNSVLVQSVFESQIKRNLKYADANDSSLCEREVLRMLQILKHLFYNSGQLLIPCLFAKAVSGSSIQQSKTVGGMSKIGGTAGGVNSKQAKENAGPIGDRVISVMANVLEDLDNSGPYE